ncbi:molecular chaperone HtpG [Zavarzinella formosa]|uniref:molecular chaperone HtpG n=1 Tax=Zavarzinella formosa TaxID=360055 RepID=UPI0002D278AE|nr:molecular chaperone HtpG [Zavarzinella formosa]
MATETMEFKTELKQLLHLITHSLYSNREIFLRELVSNASDAINKVKFDSLANEDKLEDNKDWKIRLIPDAKAGTLTISDNGIGMSRESVIEHLGTIAKSGTKAFLENLKQQDVKTRPDLIGQFGVGFYSAFMVADKVTVITRPAGSPTDGVTWVSDGQGEFSLESSVKPDRGTDVILHLKEDAKEYAQSWTLQNLVKKYSDFIEHPIVMEVETEGENEGEKKVVEEVLNSQTALWLRNKSEVKPEEYEAFYQQITNDSDKPARVIHYTAEGNNEFRVLAFIPSKKPFSYTWEEPQGMKLYIQRVLIMDSCDGLLPPYLRFIRGIVDSADLPLNISRELLQNNPLLEKIQKNLVRNILEGLEALKNTDEEKYLAFFDDFGVMLKEGASRDWSNKEKIVDLLLFQSTKTEPGKFTTLAEYLTRMPEGQKDIFYLIGESRELIENSPLLEAYKAKGWEVLLCTEPIDEMVLPSLREYKTKGLKAIDRSETETPETEAPENAEEFKPFLDYLKTKLPDVTDVRLSKRLTESASCLVADKDAMTAHYERLMKKMGRLEESSKRVLEVNPTHPAVTLLNKLYAKSPESDQVTNLGKLLYEQAVIAEGSKLHDPAGFSKRVNDLMVLALEK